MNVAAQNRMDNLQVEEGTFCQHNQWAHDCLACGTRVYGPAYVPAQPAQEETTTNQYQITSPAHGCFTVTRDGQAVYTTVSMPDAQAWITRNKTNHFGLTFICMTCGEDTFERSRVCTACLFKAQQYAAAANDATVTADDIRQDRNADNAEAYADPEYAMHVCATCDTLVPLSRERCDTCNDRIAAETAATIAGEAADAVHDRKPQFPWNARLAARAAAIVTAAGGLALALCLTGTTASANTLPLVPTDGECVITHHFEDGSATALCGPNDAWAYDADGNNPPASVGYTGPTWDAGWYPCIDASCAVIDHTH